MNTTTGSVVRDVSPMASPNLWRTESRNSAVSSINVSPAASQIFSPTHRTDDGTAHTTTSDTATSPSSENHSCNFDQDDWFGRFREDLEVSDECPDRGTLAAAGEVPLYDSHGNMRPFKTFFTGLDAIGDRQLIVFIRHFYCGACQAFMKKLATEISMQTYYTMPVPTSIIVIGCGTKALINHWKTETECPFPVFADPSRKLYRILGMSMSLNIGPRRPGYMKEISPPAWLIEQFRQMAKTKGMKKWKSGNWLQVGGEFLFQDGQVIWCHRMKNYRDHVEVPVLKKVLEIES